MRASPKQQTNAKGLRLFSCLLSFAVFLLFSLFGWCLYCLAGVRAFLGCFCKPWGLSRLCPASFAWLVSSLPRLVAYLRPLLGACPCPCWSLLFCLVCLLLLGGFSHSCTCRRVRGWSALSLLVSLLGGYPLGRGFLLRGAYARGWCLLPWLLVSLSASAPWVVCSLACRLVVVRACLLLGGYSSAFGVCVSSWVFPAGLLSCFCLCLLPCWLVSDSLQGLRPSLVAWLSSCWSLSVVVSLAGGLFFMFEASAFGGVYSSVACLSFVVLM